MDITNIPQNLIKALEQKNTEQLAVLSRVLNLVLGKTVIANVASTEPVTPPEREELLKQTTTALAQLNQQAASKLTPALKIEIARLMQQQHLIQSPELKWINLVVNNRPLLAYSDRPLSAGQTVPVQLQNPQKLVLLDSPEFDIDPLTPSKLTTATTMPSGTTSLTDTKNAVAVNELLKTAIAELANKPTTISASNMKDIAYPDTSNSKPIQQNKINLYNTNDLSLKLTAQTESKHGNSETIAAKNIVSEQLRNILPHKDTPNLLLSAVMQLQKLPASARLQLFSPSVEQALKSLAEKIRSPEQIAQPKVLTQTLKNSGVFFENKLNHLTSEKNEDAQSTHNKLNNTYSQDLKGSLLTLLNRVTQDLSGSNKPVSAEQTLKLFQNLGSGALFNKTPGVATNTDLTQSIVTLIQELMHKSVKELSNKELRAQLLVLLQQHSVHSLVKIQLQQLHSVNHELESKDTAVPNSSWQLEIPVKHNNDVHPLHLRIDREWVDEKSESESEKSTNKIKQWSVTLRFDLPTLGEFCAQLAIVNTQVSATLWAAREKTFAEVRDHVEGLRKRLESEGINVKYLQCMRGMPPQKPMVLSYSLIDIST
jgi:hypothetical protein